MNEKSKIMKELIDRYEQLSFMTVNSPMYCILLEYIYKLEKELKRKLGD